MIDIRIAIVLTILYFVIGGLLSIVLVKEPNSRAMVVIFWPIVLVLIAILMPVFTTMELVRRFRGRNNK